MRLPHKQEERLKQEYIAIAVCLEAAWAQVLTPMVNEEQLVRGEAVSAAAEIAMSGHIAARLALKEGGTVQDAKRAAYEALRDYMLEHDLIPYDALKTAPSWEPPTA